MVLLYSDKVSEISSASRKETLSARLSHLKLKEKELLLFLVKNHMQEFTPVEISLLLAVNNKTVINRLSELVKKGYAEPVLMKQRIRSYRLSQFTMDHMQEIQNLL